jgi:metal-sulfur cluster biosynthetic enzyme
MSQPLQERIAGALAQIVNPRTGTDVMSAEMIRDIATTTGGKVRLTILLTPSDPATLVRDVRQAIEALEGVVDVRVDVKDASAASGGGAPAPPAPSTARLGRPHRRRSNIPTSAASSRYRAERGGWGSRRSRRTSRLRSPQPERASG